MTTTIQAVFVHGVLRPLDHLDLAENQVVRLQIETQTMRSPGTVKQITLKGLWSSAVVGPLEVALDEVHQLAEEKIDYLADSLSSPEQ